MAMSSFRTGARSPDRSNSRSEEWATATTTPDRAQPVASTAKVNSSSILRPSAPSENTTGRKYDRRTEQVLDPVTCLNLVEQFGVVNQRTRL